MVKERENNTESLEQLLNKLSSDVARYWMLSRLLTNETPVPEEIITNNIRYLKLQNETEKAARLASAAKRFDEAGDLYLELQYNNDAAENYELAGSKVKANAAHILAAKDVERGGHYHLAGDYYEKAGENLLAARAYFRARQWEKAGKCYEKIDEPDKTRLSFEKAADASTGQEMPFNTARLYEKADLPDKAKEFYIKSIHRRMKANDVTQAVKTAEEKGLVDAVIQSFVTDTPSSFLHGAIFAKAANCEEEAEQLTTNCFQYLEEQNHFEKAKKFAQEMGMDEKVEFYNNLIQAIK